MIQTHTPRADFAPLDLRTDLCRVLRANDAHALGYEGQGAHVALIDAGFDAAHRWFDPHRAALALDADSPHDHGTMNAAMVLAVAPKAKLTGLSLFASGSVFGALERAIGLDPRPDVIVLTFVFGGDTDAPTAQADDRVRTELYLQLVQRANDAGIVVVAAAGNGDVRSVTASAPSVLSVGGVTAQPDGTLTPSWQTAHFASARFPFAPDSYVPEVCGLCGNDRYENYFRVPSGTQAGGSSVPPDGVTLADAAGARFRLDWGGSGAAAAQVAGVVALLRGANKGLSPDDVRTALRVNSHPVPSGLPPTFAGFRHDPITGFGVPDVVAVVRAVASRATVPLQLPDGLQRLLDLVRIHQAHGRGAGVSVWQLDTGRRDAHPYFAQFPPESLAPSDPDTHGHGSRIAAVFKAVAPEAALTTRDCVPDFLGALEEAVAARPDIVFAPVELQLHESATFGSHWREASDIFAALVTKLHEQGTLVLFAAGSDSSEPAQRPVSASHPDIVSVGGARPRSGDAPAPSAQTNRFDSLLFPNRRAEARVSELAAPCGDTSDDPIYLLPDLAGGFAPSWGGSSAATAAAAGIAALLKAAFPADAPDQLRDKLRKLIPDPANPHLPTPTTNWPDWAAIGW